VIDDKCDIKGKIRRIKKSSQAFFAPPIETISFELEDAATLVRIYLAL